MSRSPSRPWGPRNFVSALALVALAGLASCTSAPPVADASLPIIQGHHQQNALDPTGQGRLINRIYRLGVGDRLRVTVFGEKDLSGDFDVSVHGRVAMPLIGDVAASNLTIQEFKEAVTARLSDGYLKSPRVSVEVLNYRPFFVHGEVRSGGEYKYKPGISLRDAIAIAGGYTYRAEQSYIVLVRSRDGREVRVAMPSQATVLPGDNIKVPERFF